MKSIEIYIDIEFNILIDVINKIIILNNKQKEITDEKINELLRIIRTWENSYQSNNIIDGEEFLIKINTDNKTEIIKGKGKYPENYNLLKSWIGDIYG